MHGLGAAPREVTIIGGGVIGCCSALELLSRGFKVTIVDPGDRTCGASFGNAGVISPYSVVPISMPGAWRSAPGMLLDPQGPLFVQPSHLPRFAPWALAHLKFGNLDDVKRISAAMAPLMADAPELYERHLRDVGCAHLVERSCYIVTSRTRVFSADQLEFQLRRAAGAEIEVIDRNSLLALEPALSPEYRGGVVVHGQARTRSPGGVTTALWTKALAQGAEAYAARVRRLIPTSNGDWLVSTDAGLRRTPCVLICAGAWSDELLKPLGISLPLEREYGYHVEFLSSNISISNTIYDADTKLVTSSMERGLRVTSHADFRRSAGPGEVAQRAKLLLQHSAAMYPDLDLFPISTWGGPRPSFPDSLPVIGPVPAYRNLYAAFGHSHYGLSMAPRTGWIISRMIAGEEPGVDTTPYCVSRFSQGPKLRLRAATSRALASAST